jgi:uncharacterized coiled-coil DUF342 family protein
MEGVNGDVTVEILKSIRDELRSTRDELRAELRSTREEWAAALERTREELSERIDRVHRRQVEFEIRIGTELTSVHAELQSSRHVLVEIRDLLASGYGPRQYNALEFRVTRLEKHTGLEPSD